MSKFRGSITLSIFSLSTLSNYHYWQSPKTRYWRLVRPYQTGFPPARLLALVWAHNPDFLNSPNLNCTASFFLKLLIQRISCFMLVKEKHGILYHRIHFTYLHNFLFSKYFSSPYVAPTPSAYIHKTQTLSLRYFHSTPVLFRN